MDSMTDAEYAEAIALARDSLEYGGHRTFLARALLRADAYRETIAQEVGDLRGSRRGDIFTSYDDAYDTAIADASARIRAGGGIGPGGDLGAFIAEHFPAERGDECLSTEAVAIRLLSGIVNAVRNEREACAKVADGLRVHCHADVPAAIRARK